jgi:hypothetical protein
MSEQEKLSVVAKQNLLFAIEQYPPSDGIIRDLINTAQKTAYDEGFEAGRIQAGKEVPILLLQVAQLLEKRRDHKAHDQNSIDKPAIFRMAAEMLAVWLDDMTHLYMKKE